MVRFQHESNQDEAMPDVQSLAHEQRYDMVSINQQRLPSIADLQQRSVVKHGGGYQGVMRKGSDPVSVAIHHLETQGRDIESLRLYQEQMRNELHEFFRAQCLQRRFLQLMEACMGRFESVMNATASVQAEQRVQVLHDGLERRVTELFQAKLIEGKQTLMLEAEAKVGAIVLRTEVQLQNELHGAIDEVEGIRDDLNNRIENQLVDASNNVLIELKNDLQDSLEEYTKELIEDMKSKIEGSVRTTLLESLKRDIDGVTDDVRSNIDSQMKLLLQDAQAQHATHFTTLVKQSKMTTEELEADLSKRVENIMRDVNKRQQDAYREMEVSTRKRAATLEKEAVGKIVAACAEGRDRISKDMLASVKRVLDDPQALLDAHIDDKIERVCSMNEARVIASVQAEIQRCLKEVGSLQHPLAQPQESPGVPEDTKIKVGPQVKLEPGPSSPRKPEEQDPGTIPTPTRSNQDTTAPSIEPKNELSQQTQTLSKQQHQATPVANVENPRSPAPQAHCASHHHCTCVRGSCCVMPSKARAETQTDFDASGSLTETRQQEAVEKAWKAAIKSRDPEVADNKGLVEWLTAVTAPPKEVDRCGVTTLEVKNKLLSLKQFVDTDTDLGDYISMMLDELPMLLKVRVQAHQWCANTISIALPPERTPIIVTAI